MKNTGGPRLGDARMCLGCKIKDGTHPLGCSSTDPDPQNEDLLKAEACKAARSGGSQGREYPDL